MADSPRRRDRRNWLWALVPVGVFLVAVQFVEPRYFLKDDNALYSLPAFTHDVHAVVVDHQLAFLDLYQSRGIPHLAMGVSEVLYPPAYISVLLADWMGDVRWSIDFFVAAHLLAAAAGMYLLLRHLGLRLGAVAGAWMLATAPFVVVGARSWLSLACAVAGAVWGFVFLLRWIDRPSWGNALPLGLVQLFLFFAGHPQLLLFAGLYQGLFLAAVWIVALIGGHLTGSDLARATGRLAGMAILVAAWAAPLLLPMAAVAAVSAGRRGAIDRDIALANSLELDVFIRAQYFSFDDLAIHAASSSIFYVGLPILLGLAAAAFLRRDPPTSVEPEVTPPGLVSTTVQVRIFVVLACVAFLASTRAWGLVVDLPLLSSFRWPFKHFLYFLILAIPAAAWSLERLAQRHRRPAVALLILVLGCNLWIVGHRRTSASFGFLTIPQTLEDVRSAAIWRGLDPARRTASFRPVSIAAEPSMAPYLMAYNLATLFRIQPQFGGYDPLLSQRAFETALGTRVGMIPTTPVYTSAEALRHLGSWGVGYLLAPPDPKVREALLASGVVKQLPDRMPVDVFELLTYRPIVEDLHDRSAVVFDQETNGVSFETQGPGTAVRLAFEPIDGWSWSLDGEPQGRPEEHPDGGLVVPIPPGAHRIRLDYTPPGFHTGMIVFSVATVVFLLGLLTQRSHRP